MSYHRYHDHRFGDLYEIYTIDGTGEFESAVRSLDQPGRDPIYYDKLSDIPQPQQQAIRNLLWDKSKPSPQS